MMHNPEIVMRFGREAQAAVKIKSPHVARVIDVGELETGAPYMVMEYLDGSDLAAWLERHGALSVEQAVEFVLQACEAIAEAHALGIVHRDLKPANLFVVQGTDGLLKVKVLDFGISKTLPGSSGPDLSMTKTATTMGSPLYMSPEQMESAKSVDTRSDIWAIGVILYELLTRTTPFFRAHAAGSGSQDPFHRSRAPSAASGRSAGARADHCYLSTQGSDGAIPHRRGPCHGARAICHVARERIDRTYQPSDPPWRTIAELSARGLFRLAGATLGGHRRFVERNRFATGNGTFAPASQRGPRGDDHGSSGLRRAPRTSRHCLRSISARRKSRRRVRVGSRDSEPDETVGHRHPAADSGPPRTDRTERGGALGIERPSPGSVITLGAHQCWAADHRRRRTRTRNEADARANVGARPAASGASGERRLRQPQMTRASVDLARSW